MPIFSQYEIASDYNSWIEKSNTNVGKCRISPRFHEHIQSHKEQSLYRPEIGIFEANDGIVDAFSI